MGGDGVSVFDFISVLDRWVEQGQAPDVLNGCRPRADGSPEFDRDVPFHRTAVPER